MLHEEPLKRAFDKIQWTQQKFNDGIRDQGLKQELHLENKETFSESLGQSMVLEIAK
jgi:hypothetical protein